MDVPAILKWLDEQIAVAERELQRTTDKISVAYWAGQKAAFEAVQVKLTREAWSAHVIG